MLLDAALSPASLAHVPALARSAEALGFSAVWVSETQHNPFLPLPLVAEHTTHLRFGTAVAIAFARSPMTLAHTAWDLAGQSGGRFMLGLGTQVKAHVERRYSTEYAPPGPRMRDYVRALRAIFAAFRGGPLRWCDTEGAGAILKRVEPYVRLGKRYEPPSLLRQLVSGGGLIHPRA